MRGEKGEEMLPVTHLPSLPVARCRAEDGRKVEEGKERKGGGEGREKGRTGILGLLVVRRDSALVRDP